MEAFSLTYWWPRDREAVSAACCRGHKDSELRTNSEPPNWACFRATRVERRGRTVMPQLWQGTFELKTSLGSRTAESGKFRT